MARTQAADFDERREAIIGKAADLYAKSGFLGASIADLAEACGVSKSLLYHYFSSKEDILFEIMSSHVDALNYAADGLQQSEDAEALLRSLTHSFMALYVGASSRHKVLVNDLDKLPEARREKIVNSERRLLDTVDSILARLSEPLANSPHQRRVMTMIYFGMINWTHTWFDPRGPVNTDALADMVVSTFLHGVAKTRGKD